MPSDWRHIESGQLLPDQAFLGIFEEEGVRRRPILPQVCIRLGGTDLIEYHLGSNEPDPTADLPRPFWDGLHYRLRSRPLPTMPEELSKLRFLSPCAGIASIALGADVRATRLESHSVRWKPDHNQLPATRVGHVRRTGPVDDGVSRAFGGGQYLNRR